jgi:primosomal protein N' (replication factor Y)
MFYYEVAPTKVVRATSTVFTYHSTRELPVGKIVNIPVGTKQLLGIVMRNVPKPTYETRPIDESTSQDLPTVPRPLVTTAHWMSEYYATHLALVLQTILPRGLTKNRRALRKKPPLPVRERTHFLLNPNQLLAVEQIDAMSSGTALLHGITGSGKTAVYIELVQRSINKGQSAIVLVPEIALTSQLVAEFTQHFPNILLTHSKQTEAERHIAWAQAAVSSVPLVVIGPRSALFLPLARVGVIIIDEAHEPSFKQDQSPRYSALRVASILAKEHTAKVVQGSATPLVSEYYFLESAHQPIITMNTKARHDVTDPSVTIVDMTKKGDFTRHRLFSNTLIAAITNSIEAGNQVLIFHNRRGSASTTLCESCGWSSLCPRCFVPFTLHADRHQLECHICGIHERVPTSCPVCGSTDIIHKGIGTKLIESELRKLFPKTTIARFDGDSANEDTVEKRYQELYDGDISIIVGTQVIAKGLDLPKLRVVGVVQADAGLALPDFIASERTFQLLAQVVGRVGRSKHSTDVIVQSYQPAAPAVHLGVAQDYSTFYEETLKERRHGMFPPFTYLLKLTCIYKTEAAAIRNAKLLASTLKKKHPDVIIFGPTPSFYERQHDTYRWQIIIKSSKRARLLEILEDVPPTHWQTDIDPMSLL